MTGFKYIQLHIGDFIGGVLHMDATEVGAYTMLLVAHYQAGEEGLPDDDRKLARIAKVSLKQWGRVKDTVMDKFELKDAMLDACAHVERVCSRNIQKPAATSSLSDDLHALLAQAAAIRQRHGIEMRKTKTRLAEDYWWTVEHDFDAVVEAIEDAISTYDRAEIHLIR